MKHPKSPATTIDDSWSKGRSAVSRSARTSETVHRKKDGSAIYVDITAKAVRDDRGSLKVMTVSQKDVTQIKVSNHSKILEARYLGLLESVPDAIVMVNNTGRIVLINKTGRDIFPSRKSAPWAPGWSFTRAGETASSFPWKSA
jgi:PAS domain-containing protein